MTKKRDIILTSALPYANGHIHIGHLVEYLLGDFWSRFQKMRGHNCLYICADDTHGTPIMISAKEKGITPKELIAGFQKDHERDFAAFDIEFDNYSSTDTEKNRQLATEFFEKIKAHNMIEERTLEQAYCEHDKMFLPDRFVKGTCPKCGAKDQYGDSCDHCSATYATTELVDGSCTICGNSPVSRQTNHLFFTLNKHKDFLEKWVPNHTSKEVSNKLAEWLSEDLQDWCISRDEPYFGFEIKGYPGKYFYVWLDAPIGYISSTALWCEKNGKKLLDVWNENTEIYHNIGKDIIYFHGLFWPAMLKTAGYATPKSLFVHGMLTVNGVKMSKSKGTFINASTYLKHLSKDYLRYYFAAKISNNISDFDLNFEDFAGRVNSDLIGKITNVASRGATMLHKLDGTLGKIDSDARHLIEKAEQLGEVIAEHYENRNFSKAVTQIRVIADDANKYFDEHEPWKLIKKDPEKTKMVLTTILNLFRKMAIYLKPILPSYAQKVEKLFKEPAYTWDDAAKFLENREIEPFKHLMKRLDPKNIEAIVDETKKAAKKSDKEKSKNKKKQKGEKEAAKAKKSDQGKQIEFSDFMKVDLRIAKILEAEAIEGADKLLRVTVDLGANKRQIIAGIKTAYNPEDLIGRLTVVVANLKPKKMRFGESNGMILAAGEGGKELFLLSPDAGAKPGDRVS